MPDPIVQFNSWMEDAKRAGIDEPTAMALATADLEGRPTVRMVLLKHADEHGFVFYTNLESAKAAQLKVNPQAELCFYWGPLTRQVRVTGPVERTTEAEADAYFATRPRLSQIGAWASQQSRPMRGGYFELEQACALVAMRYPLGPVPRPPFWSGYRVVPERIEFWKQKPFRRHERVVYIRDGSAWQEQWLFP